MHRLLHILALSAAAACREQLLLAPSRGITVGKRWEAVGPWSIGTREWPLAGGPCDLDVHTFGDIAANASLSCPSTLVADEKLWRAFDERYGHVEVAFEDIDWATLRSYKGWAGLQHQTFLRTYIEVHEETDVRIEVKGGTEFATSALPGQVFTANFYGYPGDHSHHVHLPRGRHTIAVRQVYDTRSRGDPHDRNTSMPTSRFSFKVQPIRPSVEPLRLLQERTVVPDRLPDGFLATPLIGVWLRSTTSEPLQIRRVEERGGLGAAFLQHTPVNFGPFASQQLQLGVSFAAEATTLLLEVFFVFERSPSEELSMLFEMPLPTPLQPNEALIRFTYSGADQSIQWAMLKKPYEDCKPDNQSPPVIIALHGAGGNADDQSWTDSVRRQKYGVFVVYLQGRSPWSFDWHASGARDIDDALRPLSMLHARLFGGYCAPNINSLIIIGHSNGGQGTWYFGSRSPDRVLAIAPAAAYAKVADYVPFDYELAHYVDPALKAVLFSGLMPYDNELHLSNLFATPTLAQHGTEDSNVPIFHSRRLVAIARIWSSFSMHELVEIPHTNHWWPTVFDNSRFQQFLDNVYDGLAPSKAVADMSFTLTTSMPDESGPLFGIRISQLEVPGKIARLDVTFLPGGDLLLVPANVAHITLDERHAGRRAIINDRTFSLPQNSSVLAKGETWQVATTSSSLPFRRMGPAMQILDGSAPLIVLHGRDEASAAARLMVAIQMHGGPKVHTLLAQSSAPTISLIDSSHIILGWDGVDTAMRAADGQGLRPPVERLSWNAFAINGRVFQGEGYGLIFTLPHPFKPTLRALAVVGNGQAGFERALRAFPLISGTPLPEWAVFSPRATDGHLVAAGWWAADWGWNEQASFLPM